MFRFSVLLILFGFSTLAHAFTSIQLKPFEIQVLSKDRVPLAGLTFEYGYSYRYFTLNSCRRTVFLPCPRWLDFFTSENESTSSPPLEPTDRQGVTRFPGGFYRAEELSAKDIEFYFFWKRSQVREFERRSGTPSLECSLKGSGYRGGFTEDDVAHFPVTVQCTLNITAKEFASLREKDADSTPNESYLNRLFGFSSG